jgi:hypothetical protein
MNASDERVKAVRNRADIVGMVYSGSYTLKYDTADGVMMMLW